MISEWLYIWLPILHTDISVDLELREQLHGIVQLLVCTLWRSKLAKEQQQKLQFNLHKHNSSIIIRRRGCLGSVGCSSQVRYPSPVHGRVAVARGAGDTKSASWAAGSVQWCHDAAMLRPLLLPPSSATYIFLAIFTRPNLILSYLLTKKPSIGKFFFVVIVLAKNGSFAESLSLVRDWI
jgi:hypothetical protein